MPTLKLFYSGDCGACQTVLPGYQEMKNVKKIDVEKRPDLAKKYKITATPTLIVEKRGKRGRRIIGRCEGTSGQAQADVKQCTVEFTKKKKSDRAVGATLP